ncbi:MAG: FMN-binding glutamate synthase family protein [Clostridia bacterium]|jgi:glutamate synthase domain-containing protein 2|nr:FMN-binding glutamate synthase family protein [Clostridia bacterium]
MAKYKCLACGYIYDEEKEKIKWEDLPEDWVCPLCKSPKSYFEKIEDTQNIEVTKKEEENDIGDLSYDKDLINESPDVDSNMKIIHKIATTGETIIEPMSSKKDMLSWDDILILGAQLNPMPLDEKAEVNTTTIIGKNAKKPMIIESPIYISHMSFGALSREAKIALAKGSCMAKTAMCSGEGGILKEEKEESYKYIFEYVPNLYSVTDENLENSDAIEIKIGQGTKPGMGGHLPAQKVTEEIAKVRNKPMGKDIISPSCFENIKTKEDLKELVTQLRQRSKGRPIGIKIAAGNIEKDLEWIAYAQPDFVTIDGRGGATGASPKIIKDSTSIPTIYALHRARKFIKNNNLDIDLVITGGLRISSDFAKALAMGADAIAISSAALMAIACQQYRICQNGYCPLGVATQDEELRKRMHIQTSSKRLYNYLNVSLEELKTFARITGNDDVHKLNIDNLCTTNSEISENTDIKHA